MFVCCVHPAPVAFLHVLPAESFPVFLVFVVSVFVVLVLFVLVCVLFVCACVCFAFKKGFSVVVVV